MMILNTPSRSWPIGGRPPGAGKGGEGRRVPWPSQRWCMVLPVDWLKWCRRTSVELQKGGGADGQPSLNFFNVWPAEDKPAYMSMWPRERVEEITNGTGPAQFLLDVTPEYLMNAVVPPRLKQLVPQAKVVIVLQVRFLLPPSPPPPPPCSLSLPPFLCPEWAKQGSGPVQWAGDESPLAARLLPSLGALGPPQLHARQQMRPDAPRFRPPLSNAHGRRYSRRNAHTVLRHRHRRLPISGVQPLCMPCRLCHAVHPASAISTQNLACVLPRPKLPETTHLLGTAPS